MTAPCYTMFIVLFDNQLSINIIQSVTRAVVHVYNVGD